MSKKTVIIYASVDGQTLKICNILKHELEKENQIVDLFSIDHFTNQIEDYDRIIIGSSIRYGVHNKNIIEFINTNKDKLDKVKNAFFSVNLVARKPEKQTAETNPYVIKFFNKIEWNPTIIKVFAGKINYKKYSFSDRLLIQLIMLITKGPTNSDAEIEYTNWGRVKAFGKELTLL